ncbi:initiation-control protein YabA [Trichonephila inaurata madagascariensis]|uniref:Initiation-control protein YabA n=1 Tax=Trichonephila inaurata madagascariensis TaxID=2747483 RepID=A0A8X6YYP4_9ARAC|nr:initiation-control protein YabA [Trichonephila inaurata madagascariensis]
MGCSNEVIKVELSSTCECGGRLQYAKPYIHQKVDLPEIKPYVVEYQLEHGRSEVRKKKKQQITRRCYIRYIWTRVKSIIAAFSGFYKNSKREIASDQMISSI